MSEPKEEAKPKTAIPVVEKESPTSTARTILNAIIARDTVIAEEKAAQDSKDVWAYSCDRKKGHVGILFTEDPSGRTTFGPGDWYAIYHDPAKPFDFELADIVCQECFLRTGERVHLRVSQAPSPGRGSGQHFQITQTWKDRFLHKIPRETLEKWSAQFGKQPAATR